MKKTFVIADTHFGHKGVCQFTDSEGNKLRPWDNPEDMNKALIDNWNNVVSKDDIVYVLGDVVINRRYLSILESLKGRKILVAGNHDNFRLSEYMEYFEDIKGCVVYKHYLLTHIPVHPCQKDRFKGNIHGHLHNNFIKKEGDGWVGCDKNPCDECRDIWYICVSVEKIGYKPIDLDEICV